MFIYSFGELSTIFIAWATLALAVATFFMVEENRRLIKENQERDKRDRRDQILKEISQWAEDILEIIDKFNRGF